MTEDVFAAWQADRAAGLDSIMLAPTRDLVSELNQQARAHRLDGMRPGRPAAGGPVRRLADGNEASIGELIITRENDRRLRTSATDWVKNGDRWTVLQIHDGGDLTVQHTAATAAPCDCPADYVASGPPSSATPAPCTPPRASPPTPCTAWPPAPSRASSSTR